VISVQLNVTSRTEEPLLARTMVKAALEFEKSTPSYAEVTASLAASLKSDEKLIAIRHIYNSFGSKKANVIAYLYNDEAKKQLIEPKLKVKKEKKPKAAKK
jgi:ribosomal protein S24E